jgi:hypothetical protein
LNAAIGLRFFLVVPAFENNKNRPTTRSDSNNDAHRQIPLGAEAFLLIKL